MSVALHSFSRQEGFATNNLGTLCQVAYGYIHDDGNVKKDNTHSKNASRESVSSILPQGSYLLHIPVRIIFNRRKMIWPS
jgi:hypothetical protein